MNSTWFASAYDNGDTAFRLLTMLSMAGSLTIAAGIDAFSKSSELVAALLISTAWWRNRSLRTAGVN